MKTNQLLKTAAVLAVFSLLTTGCGQGMVGAGMGSSGGSMLGGVDQSQLDKIQNHMESAESAMADAQSTLDKLVVGNQLSLSFDGQTKTADVMTQSLTGIPERVRAALDTLYSRLSLPIQAAKLAIEKTRSQIAASMVLLNPNDPNQASMIAKLQDMLAKLDSFEARISGIYKTLASKVDLLIGKLDGLIAKLSASNPLLGLVALSELQGVREALVDFRDKLANT